MSRDVVPRIFLTIGSLVVCATLCACGSKSPDATATPSAAQSAAPTAKENAVRVYVDPKTGEIREPTPEEVAAEAAADADKTGAGKKQAAATNTQAEQSQPHEVVTPSGAVEITLDPAAQRPVYGCVGKQGDVKVDHDCDQSSRDQPK